jgi:Icc protein
VTQASVSQVPRREFCLVHLTDPHVPAEDQPLVHGVDTVSRFAATVESINRLFPSPECVILTGDLSVAGSPRAARRAVGLLRSLRLPVRLTFGNHDDPEALRSLLGEVGHEPAEKACQAFDVHGWRILLLDSSDPGMKGGFLGARQRRQMRADLARPPRLPALLFLHHHVLPLGLPWVDPDNLHDWCEFLEILREVGTVRGVFSGHAHQANRQEWSGIPFFVTPSAGYQFFRDPAGPRVSHEPPAYRLIRILENAFFTEIHPVRVAAPACEPARPGPPAGA